MKNKKLILAITILLVVVIAIVLGYKLTKKDKNTLKSGEVDLKAVDHGYIVDEYNEKYKDSYIEDYDTYQKFIDDIKLEKKLTKKDFEEHSYLVLIVPFVECSEEIVGVSKTFIESNVLTVTFDVEQYCGLCAPANKSDIDKKIKVVYEYNTISEEEYCDNTVVYKPIIYLYPVKTTEVIVRLVYPEKLTTTYPKYETEWYVSAKPNGDLIDLNTGRSLYGFYWEGLNNVSKGVQEEGFVVKSEDTIAFLEEKLATLGLTEREANEFIIYWLPVLEENKYNYIRFETMEEINENMPLEIRPTPDTVIRVVMEFKGLERPIEVKEQQLVTPTRTGFTVVEWGGTKLK